MVLSQVESHREYPFILVEIMEQKALVDSLLLVVTAACALTDVRDGKVYNVVVVPAAIAAMIMQGVPSLGGSIAMSGAALLRSISAMLLLLPFWVLFPSGIGGGDIKLYMVVASVLPWEEFLILLLLSLLLSAIYGIFMRLVIHDTGQLRIGPAVFCASLLYIGGIYG